MGSGKSTLGSKLARLRSLNFVDLDNLITEKEGRSINEIFNDSGEDYFRDVERSILIEQLQRDHFILATGGGTPCFFNNIDLMNESGVTVYFRLTPGALFKRLQSRHATRPLISSYDQNELLSYIETKLKEREFWYLKSKLVINEPDQNPGTIARVILEYNP